MGRPWEFFANPEDPNHDSDLERLAKSARTSFEIVELWQERKSYVYVILLRRIQSSHSNVVNSFDNPHIQGMVDKIINQGPRYYPAIQKSAETAQKDCSFAADALDFCQRLFRAEDSVDTAKAGLDNIKQVAKSAHLGSTEMNTLFKLVRIELFKVRPLCFITTAV